MSDTNVNQISRDEAIRQITGPGKPHHLVDATVNGQTMRVFQNGPKSLRQMYEESISDLPFISYEDEHLSFAQAWAESSRIAQVLIDECGVAKGDRVAIAMRNYPEWMLAFTAATSIGAIAVAVNSHWQADELAYGLEDCGAKVIVADQERLDRLAERPAISGLHVLAVRSERLPAGALDLKALTSAIAEAKMPAAQIEPDDLATILYTSGSTGHPKGVPSSHRNILAALLCAEAERHAGELITGIETPKALLQAGTLLAVPLFHVTGLLASFLMGYRIQRRSVCMYRWDVEKAAAMIESEGLTTVYGPAAITGDLVKIGETGRYDLSCLRSIGGGGAPRAPNQVARIGAVFGNCMPVTGWGMTETNAIGTSINGPDYLEHSSSAGRVAYVLDIRIVMEDGTEAPQGGRGELQVRGTSMFRGYWNRPDSPTNDFDNGWFRTGDVAYLDAEGYLYIVDRIKELIIRGGENIGCGQVEAALLLHPAIHETSVYAVPDERLGEEVGATILVDSPIDETELREFLVNHLAKFEVPRYIRQTTLALPRTPSGKILRREIRGAALKEMGIAA